MIDEKNRKQLLLTTDKDALKQEWLQIIWLRGGKGIPLSIQIKKAGRVLILSSDFDL
ncbi:MAG: hypothetical protein JST20_10735 [Bacteroidetes bacterium]|nr:hypothetical protein [Bacteroidota bacterium]